MCHNTRSYLANLKILQSFESNTMAPVGYCYDIVITCILCDIDCCMFDMYDLYDIVRY